MFNLNDFLVLTTWVVFAVLGLASLTTYFRYKDLGRRDTALMFVSIAVNVVVQLVNSFLSKPNFYLALIGTLALLAQPYLLIRIVEYFHAVPRMIRFIALGGLLASWLIVLFSGGSLRPSLSLLIVFYFVFIDGYGMAVFIQEAWRTSGVVQQRLRLIAAGAGLFALALLLIGVILLWSAAATVLPAVIQMIGIASAVCFYLGFITPRWLQRTWQLAELREFLLAMPQGHHPEVATEVYTALCQGALELTGGSKAYLLLIPENGVPEGVYFELEAGLGTMPATVVESLPSLGEHQSPIAIDTNELSRPLRQNLDIGTAGFAYIVPLIHDQQLLGYILLFLQRRSLFVEDDLEMIGLFAEQCAITLQNITLFQKVTKHAEHLEEQVKRRTVRLIQRNEQVILLQKITQAANEATTIHEPLQQAIQLICETLDLPIGHAFAPDENDPERMESTDIWYLAAPEKHNAFRVATNEITYSSKMGGVRQVIASAAPLWLTNLAEQPDYRRAEVVKKLGIRTGIFIPILSRQETEAILEFYDEELREPDKELLGILLQIGTELGRLIERKRAEIENRFQATILRSISDAVITTDLNFEINSWNEEAADLYGWSAEEAIGQKMTDIVPTSYANESREEVLATFAEEGTWKGEVIQQTKDGTELYILSSVNSILNERGIPTHLVAVNRDITYRKRMEEELHIREREFRNTFEQAAVGMAHVSPQGNFIRVNQRFGQIVGYTPDQLLQLTFQDITHPDDLEADLAHVRQLLNGDKHHYSLEKRYKRKDGTFVWINLTVAIVRDEAHRPAYFIAVIEDIDERKKIERQLREREKTLALSLQAAEAGVWVWDINKNKIFWDEALEGIYGLASSTFEGVYEGWKNRVHPEDIEAAEQAVLDALNDKDPFDTEFRIVWPDGRVRHVIGKAVVLVDESNKPAEMIGVNIDITERKEAEEKIRRLNAELEQRVKERTAHLTAVNKELEAFSYSVSHDLRAPLRAVDGFSLALLEDYYDLLDEMGRDFLKRIRKESQRMGQLIDDLIALSRYTRMEIGLQKTNLSMLVQEIATELQQNDPDRNVNFVIQKDLEAYADPRLMQIVLQNLLSNAWKFTAKVTCARIEFGQQEETGDQTTYYVRDNGAGFDEAYAHKLFGAFQRLHTVNEFEGTGIGLATVQRIIHRHGGTIRAEGAVDEGAVFFFTLPNNKGQRRRPR